MTYGHALPLVLGSYTPMEKKPRKQTARGYDAARRPNCHVLLGDHEVLEARWLFHYAGWSMRRVSAFYGLEYGYAYRLLTYQTRGKLSPNEDDFPKGHAPAVRVKEPS